MKNKARVIDIIFFGALLAVFLTFFARLVYCQTIYAEMPEKATSVSDNSLMLLFGVSGRWMRQ